MANYHGTLAAVRALGRAGIGVVTADPNPIAAGGWSRYARTRVQAPPVQEPDKFVEWLLAFGTKHGKHVLLPTCDNTAWLYAVCRGVLSRHFYLPPSSIDTIYRLLNKRTLYQEAVKAGLKVPQTWFPQSAEDLKQCAREARFPVLVKPLTQVMFKSQKKGTLVESSDELESRYFAIASQPYATQLLEFDPAAPRPMVQEFFRDAATGIYNISAFVHSGRLCGALGARKLLQQPRRVGTGVCFEEAPVVPELAAGLERLAVQVGFSGVFEAEFINADANPLLIDFNPRFYNQMQFDIARGLPLPLLAYHDALGNHRDVEGLVDRVQLEDGPGNRVYVDLISLRTLFWAQGLSGAISPAERKQWNDWYMQHRDRCIYAAFDPDDKIPFWVAAVQHVARSARHPRHFLRSMVLNRS